jgi:hypothetical protein
VSYDPANVYDYRQKLRELFALDVRYAENAELVDESLSWNIDPETGLVECWARLHLRLELPPITDEQREQAKQA